MNRDRILAFLIPVAVLSSSCATSPLGRRQLILLPDAQMSSLGAQSFDMIKTQTPMEKSPAMDTYVRCIVDPMLALAGSSLPPAQWEVVVFRDETANAFALPGGKIGVHTGLLKVAKTDAQLAAVLGHEIGHVLARHGAERMSQGVVANLGQAALAEGLKGSANAPLIMAAVGVGAQVGAILPFSRKHESEADLMGLDLMASAGFDPSESVALWRNMQAASGGKAPPQWLSTHPSNETRIKDLEAHFPVARPKFMQAQAAGRKPVCRRP